MYLQAFCYSPSCPFGNYKSPSTDRPLVHFAPPSSHTGLPAPITLLPPSSPTGRQRSRAVRIPASARTAASLRPPLRPLTTHQVRRAALNPFFSSSGRAAPLAAHNCRRLTRSGDVSSRRGRQVGRPPRAPLTPPLEQGRPSVPAGLGRSLRLEG